MANRTTGVLRRRSYTSVREEAERLGVSTSWLLTRCRAGELPHFRLGKRVVFDSDQLDDHLDRECAVRPESD